MANKKALKEAALLTLTACAVVLIVLVVGWVLIASTIWLAENVGAWAGVAMWIALIIAGSFAGLYAVASYDDEA